MVTTDGAESDLGKAQAASSWVTLKCQMSHTWVTSCRQSVRHIGQLPLPGSSEVRLEHGCYCPPFPYPPFPRRPFLRQTWTPRFDKAVTKTGESKGNFVECWPHPGY